MAIMGIAIIISALAAIVPTVAYSIAFYWADRYEREPRSLILIAFMWGAIPAVVVSLLFEVALGSPFVADSNLLHATVMEQVVVAPIIEELAKAIALLALFVWKRNEFDGVLDGLIYGALVGFGFAMTENFLYFVGAYGEGGFASLSFVIFLRAIIFGLNHAFYTSFTGIGFGLARNLRSATKRILLILTGLSAAILIHALHNAGIVLSNLNPAAFLLSLFIAMCGVGLVALTVYLSWRHEREVIRTELAEEIGNLLTVNELVALTDHWRQPMRSRSLAGRNQMALYVELAVRKRRLRMRGAQAEEGLLEEIEELRGRLAEMKT